MPGEIRPVRYERGASLVDLLDRVLDKGLVVAGDVKISLAEVELLTIRIRLIICSIDKAAALGLDWWKHDRHLAPGQALAEENVELRRHIRLLERRIETLAAAQKPRTAPIVASRTRRRGRTT